MGTPFDSAFQPSPYSLDSTNPGHKWVPSKNLERDRAVQDAAFQGKITTKALDHDHFLQAKRLAALPTVAEAGLPSFFDGGSTYADLGLAYDNQLIDTSSHAVPQRSLAELMQQRELMDASESAATFDRLSINGHRHTATTGQQRPSVQTKPIDISREINHRGHHEDHQTQRCPRTRTL